MAYSTTQKRALLQTLKNAKGSALSVEEIIWEIRTQGFEPSKSTIYRLLDGLITKGLVNRYRIANKNCYVYVLNDKPKSCMGHLHLQCEKCHRLIHLDEEDSLNIRKTVKSAGFSLDNENTTIWGYCEGCSDDKEV
ncbi:MAG: transcriptional repressor [Eubacteriales bacterium]|nr:transcriptional repressor [Eubacteriales bacterium]